MLLVTGLASCGTYVSMHENEIGVGVSASKVIFAYGADSAEAGTEIGPNTTRVSFHSLSGWPNATRIYEDPARVENTEAEGDESHAVELVFDQWSGDTDWVDLMEASLFNGSTQVGSTVEVGVQGSSTGELLLPAGGSWRIELEIRWKPSCPQGASVTASLALRVS